MMNLGSYQNVELTELSKLRELKLKNSAGLPDNVTLQSRNHLLEIFQLRLPSTTSKTQSSTATGSELGPSDSLTP